MKTAFRTNSNRLSFYALCCGYIYRATEDGVTIDLYLENAAPRLYSVKGYSANGRLFWEQFEKKAEAERFYSNECRKIGAKNILR